MNRETTLMILARNYTSFLTVLEWQNSIFVKGLAETRRKALSGFYMAQMEGVWKYHQTNYVSQGALELLHAGSRRPQGLLCYEHIIPSRQYIVEPCEKAAREGTLTKEFVLDLLRRYWWLATILKEEDRLLSMRTMPAAWDGDAIFSRYSAAGIKLVENPYCPLNREVS